MNISEQVKIQKNSIVSSAIINKKAGTVTVFAFDKGQSLSEHKAAFDAFILILNGKAEVNVEDKKYVLESGESILIPANKRHSVMAQEAFKMLLVMIKSRD